MSRRRQSRRPLLIAALCGILILGSFAYLALTAQNGLPLVSYYRLNAEFRNASQIDPYSDVRIGGVLVGQVLGSSYRHGMAVVHLQLRGSAGPLRASTQARIRLRIAGTSRVSSGISAGGGDRSFPPNGTSRAYSHPPIWRNSSVSTSNPNVANSSRSDASRTAKKTEPSIGVHGLGECEASRSQNPSGTETATGTGSTVAMDEHCGQSGLRTPVATPRPPSP